MHYCTFIPTCIPFCTPLMFSCLTLICFLLFLLFTSHSLPSSHSAPTHLLSALIFILSCSFPLLPSFYNTLSFPLIFSSVFFTHSSVTLPPACWDGIRTIPVRRGRGVPFSHSIYSSIGKDMRKQRELNCDDIGTTCHIHKSKIASIPCLPPGDSRIFKYIRS